MRSSSTIALGHQSVQLAIIPTLQTVLLHQLANNISIATKKIKSPVCPPTSRLMAVSRKAKKKQHACASSGLRDQYNELFTWMAALKLLNTITQPL